MQSPAGFMTKVMLTFGTWQMACGALHCNHLPERELMRMARPSSRWPKACANVFSAWMPSTMPWKSDCPMASRLTFSAPNKYPDTPVIPYFLSLPLRRDFLTATAIGKGSGSGDNSSDIPFG
jgi:hypothetical protein